MWEHLPMGSIQSHRSRFNGIEESIHKEEGPTLNSGPLQCLEITPKGKPAKKTAKGQHQRWKKYKRFIFFVSSQTL